MKQPTGGLDVAGSVIMLGSDILSIIKDNMPTREERKVNVGLRRLKRRYKDVPIEVYVKANFDYATEERQMEIINYYKSILNR